MTYDVVIAADNTQMLLAPGMTANVKIIKEEHPNALRVPLQAVQHESSADSEDDSAQDSRNFVWIINGAHREKVTVRTGIRNARYVEVFSERLHEGDLVIVQMPESNDSAHASPLPPPPPGMP